MVKARKHLILSIMAKKAKVKNTDNKNVEYFETFESPFTIVKVTENKVQKCYILLGNKKASAKEFADLKSAREYVDSKPWELIFNLSYFIKHHDENTENENA